MRRDLPRFVSKSPSEVVGGFGAVGEGRVQNDDTIQLGSTGIVVWEGSISKKATIGEAGIGH